LLDAVPHELLERPQRLLGRPRRHQLEPREHERVQVRPLPVEATRPPAAIAIGTINPRNTARASFGNGGRVLSLTIPRSIVFFASFQLAHCQNWRPKKNTNSTPAIA